MNSERIGKEETYTLIVAGSCGTGKTCLWKRFAGEDFPKGIVVSISCDADTRSRTVQLDNERVRISVRDLEVFPEDNSDYTTASTTAELECSGEQFTRLFSECDGCFLVYDVSDEDTFTDLSHWLNQIRAQRESSPSKCSPRIMLVGNKCDLVGSKMVRYCTAKHFADEQELPLVELSAKDGTNIDFAILSMITLIQQTRTHA